jgi:hypothetical protein
MNRADVQVSDCRIGACVRFLAGNEARWITGAILPVDAGATAGVELASNLGIEVVKRPTLA